MTSEGQKQQKECKEKKEKFACIVNLFYILWSTSTVTTNNKYIAQVYSVTFDSSIYSNDDYIVITFYHEGFYMFGRYQ